MPEMPMNAVLPPVRPEAPKSAAASAPAVPPSNDGTRRADNGTEAKQDTPFAAELKKQMADSDNSASATTAAATEATPAQGAQLPEMPPADALAALIPLLAAQQNVAPAPLVEDKATPKAEIADEASPADAALAALLPATANVAPISTSDNSQKTLGEKPAEPRSNGQPLALVDGKAANSSNAAANLAAAESLATSEQAKGSSEATASGIDFTAALHAARQANEQMARTTGPSAPSALPQGRVETPMGSAGWANEVGDKMTWMTSSQLSKAELVLNPPDLGRIEVSLTIKGDQATAQFISANPQVRDTLEASIPRLREVLADAGVNLGQTHVGSEAQNQSSAQGDSRDNRNANNAGDFAANLPEDMRIVHPDPSAWTRRGSGMLDVFA